MDKTTLATALFLCGVDDRVATRFVNKVDFNTGSECWNWTGAQRDHGHGVFWDGTIATSAHRIIYGWFYGPVDFDLVIDHLCRNPPCVNPSHLEAVTQKENQTRAVWPRSSATHCKNGHEFTEKNTAVYIQRRNGRPYRQCKQCVRNRRNGGV